MGHHVARIARLGASVVIRGIWCCTTARPSAGQSATRICAGARQPSAERADSRRRTLPAATTEVFMNLAYYCKCGSPEKQSSMEAEIVAPGERCLDQTFG